MRSHQDRLVGMAFKAATSLEAAVSSNLQQTASVYLDVYPYGTHSGAQWYQSTHVTEIKQNYPIGVLGVSS